MQFLQFTFFYLKISSPSPIRICQEELLIFPAAVYWWLIMVTFLTPKRGYSSPLSFLNAYEKTRGRAKANILSVCIKF